MSEKIKSAWPRIVFKTCVFAALSFAAAHLLITGFNTTSEQYFGYKEKGNIDYVVNLKSGNFLNEESLASGEIYYADTIDSVDTNYKYSADFTHPVTGEYSYYFVAKVTAERGMGEQVWSKTTQLTEKTTKKINNSKKLSIDAKQPIYYQDYNKVLQDFIDNYSAPSTGKLIVQLVVEGKFDTEIMDRAATLKSTIDLTMPLAQESIKFTVSADTDNNGKIYTKKVDIDNDSRRFSRFAGMLVVVSIIYLIVCQIRADYIERKKHAYEYTVKKLRDDYDNLIVDLTKAPAVGKLHLVEVMEFDELLDVRNSVKQPINYFEAKDGAHFILINDRLAWEYVVRKPRNRRPVAAKTATHHRRSIRRKK